MRHAAFAIAFCAGLLAPTVGKAQKTKVLADFEATGELRVWEFKHKSAALSDRHVTHGKTSLTISGNEYLVSFRLPRDWSGYDSLDVDVFVEGSAPVAGTLLIGDKPWEDSGRSYWNRHNGSFNLKPGANTLSIPVNGLYRGEAGSRGHDLKTNLDPKQIVRFDIGFTTNEPAAVLYVDHFRLTKSSRPDGILAFDFGPDGQPLAPGFTAVSPATIFGKNGATAGFRYDLSAGRTRDDTFPTRLYQDWVNVDGEEFTVDVPADGAWHGWVVYGDLGYWGGEQAQFRSRSILSGGKTVWAEDRGEDGPADYLYRFERVEPKLGDSVWEVYMRPLVEPRRFTATAGGGKLALRFRSDGDAGSRVAALVLYPDAKRAVAERWVAEVEARNRKEFEDRAVFMGPQQGKLDVPPAAAAKGWWVGFPAVDATVRMTGAPGPADGTLHRPAAPGQRVALTFAVRPLTDNAASGDVSLVASDLTGPGGKTIPAAEVDVRYVHHGLRRGYNNVAYTIEPDTLRPVAGSGLRLTKDLTRQFWLTLHVPPGTRAGTYAGRVTLAAGAAKETLPVSVEVLDFTLDEPADFPVGFYGTALPRQVAKSRGADAWRELFRTLRQAGMTSFAGGPAVKFSGFDAAGQPILDFAACDEFFRIAKEEGFTGVVNGYGGVGAPAGLHAGSVVGDVGRAWERKTGKPFGELLRTVWTAVDAHAKQAGWPRIQHSFIDEPRVAERARQELELMKLYREHAPFVHIGGSYSVHWDKQDPLEEVVRELFKTMHWSALNLHTQTDLDKAKELGKELLIYNQGRSRFSYGAYQWAERHKGVRGRIQWHLLALHGYQFFDLDGREPDTAMVHWGRNGIIPTWSLHQAREGMDDFRYAVTLWNAAGGKDTPAAKEAVRWLEDVSRQIGVGQRSRPDGLPTDDAFRAECVRRIRQVRGGA